MANHAAISQEAVQSGSTAAAGGIALIGLTVPLPALVAGMLFCLVGGFVGMAVSPPKERMGIVQTLICAAFMGLMAAYVQPLMGGVNVFNIFTTPLVLGTPQLLPFVMGTMGLISRWAAKRMSSGNFTLPKFGKEEA